MFYNRFLQRPIHTLLVSVCSITLFSLSGGCASKVSVTVKPLTSQTFSPVPPTTVIDEWKIPPKQSYLELAKLIATSSGDDEEAHVKERLMKRARQLGADATIVVKSDVSEEMGNPHYNTASTSEVKEKASPSLASHGLLMNHLRIPKGLPITSRPLP